MESTTMTESIGIIGLGLVGSALAELLQARGIRVVGCDIDPSKKAAHMARGGESVGTPDGHANRHGHERRMPRIGRRL